MRQLDLIPRLYRQEYSKMVSLLCSRFGIDQIDAAEDVVSETFLSAAETWGLDGVPDNPVAWLYRVARNNALNGLKRERIFQQRVKGELVQLGSGGEDADIDFSSEAVIDSQLQLLLAVCHPAIPVDAQISLALRVLCGFSIDEVANALLTNKANVNKRLYRAKEKLRTVNIPLALPESVELGARLDAVLMTLYLLFNEGYYSASTDTVLRKDLCWEAMRLAYLLAEYCNGSAGVEGGEAAYSLLALMCFQASRFDARVNSAGELVLYEQQDSTLWDTELIGRGNYFFVQACRGGEVSRYHVEAAIAWWHTRQDNSEDKWQNILSLYNQLLLLRYSPVAALNRAYAFSRVFGKERAVVEAEKLDLEGNQFYHSLLGELYTGLDDRKARSHFQMALTLARADAEKAVIARKMACLPSDSR